MRHGLIAVLLVGLVGGGLGPLASAHSSFDGCEEPGVTWATGNAADLGLDAAKVQQAIDFAMTRSTKDVAVYRAGCLVASVGAPGVTHESFSVSKSVTSLLVGRALTLGLLALDDTVGDWFPEAPADTPHRDVTLRHLLTQASGVHWNFFRDYLLQNDRIKDFFALDFDHEPGTFFEYAQTPITVVAEIVTRAAERDVQVFAQDELFGPIGIEAGTWTWTTDLVGHAAGYYGLNMEASDFARFGELMRRGGVWNGHRLIDEGYLTEAVTPSATNPAYGYLFWLNGSTEGNIQPTIYARDVRDARAIQTAPSDLYMAAGYQDQRIWVIPSLDMVVTRFGYPGSREPDTRSSWWTSASGEFEHEFFRLLMDAVTDPEGRAHIPEPEPYESPETVPTVDPSYSIVGSATEVDEILEGATAQ